MVIKVDFDTIKCERAKSVKLQQEDKKVTPYLVLYADESNIDEALEWSRNSKQVVLLYFVGDKEVLRNKKLEGSKIAIKIEPEIIDDDFVTKLSEYPNSVRLVCKLPDTFVDMRQVYTLSKLFSNIRFCGGNLISLSGCRLGCISSEDLGRKPKQGITISSCFAVDKPVDISSQELIFEMQSAVPSDTGSKSGQKSRSPKTVLPSFATLGGLDSF